MWEVRGTGGQAALPGLCPSSVPSPLALVITTGLGERGWGECVCRYLSSWGGAMGCWSVGFAAEHLQVNWKHCSCEAMALGGGVSLAPAVSSLRGLGRRGPPLAPHFPLGTGTSGVDVSSLVPRLFPQGTDRIH